MNNITVKRTAWIDGENGPICECGSRTKVRKTFDNWHILFCVDHLDEGVLRSLIIPLPNARPANWPDLTFDDVNRMSNNKIGRDFCESATWKIIVKSGKFNKVSE
jgi:hypothetical protein